MSKLTKIPNRTVYYSLNKLEKERLVIHSHPFWKVCKDESKYPELAKILKGDSNESHDCSFVMRLMDKPTWWNERGNFMQRQLGIEVKPIKWGNNNYFQFKNTDCIIQTFSDSIVIIFIKRFLGRDGYDCFIQAAKEFLVIYESLEKKFKFRFFHNGIPQVSVRSQHHVKLMDYIANRCKKYNEKFEVVIDGNVRLYVDMSQPLGMEASNPNSSLQDITTYQEYVADLVKNKPSFNSVIDKRINDLTSLTIEVKEDQRLIIQAWSDYGKHIMSHIEAIRSLDEGIREFRELVKRKLGDS